MEQTCLSYRELNAQANRLAHYLVALGVQPEDRIALCLERSPAMLVGLARHPQGRRCRVPLDPAYPGERLQQMLATDAAPVLLLCDAAEALRVG